MLKLGKAVVLNIKTFTLAPITKELYRIKPSDFIRHRKLPFELVALCMLKTLRMNLALEIESFMDAFGHLLKRFTPSAFIQARQKVKPELFAAISNIVVDTFYKEVGAACKTYKGHRLLAIDGSTVNLPFTPDLIETYGVYTNTRANGDLIVARVSMLYDVLNELALEGFLQPFSKSEQVLAKQHFDTCQPGDVVLMDRAYPSFDSAFTLHQKGVHFIFRCKESYSNQTRWFMASGKREAFVELEPSHSHALSDKPYDKQARLRVRLIHIALGGGKVELLMTSLLDEQQYPYSDFKGLYCKRWRIETFYDRFKNLVAVERFSGTSHQFIQQEFYCALYLANMQTTLLWDAQQEVDEKQKHRQYAYKVDSSVSLGFIRKKLLDIFANEDDVEKSLEDLKQFFIRNTNAVRPGRTFNRDPDKYRNRTTPKQFTNRRILP
ncbi:MAG: IS4 family transposase [Chitinophagales bacterium]